MNRITIFTVTAILATGAIAVAGCAGPREINTAGTTVLSLKELNSSGENLAAKLTAGESVIIEIEEGEKIPISIETALPFLKLETSGSQLEFTRKTYVLVCKKGLMISPDKERWAPIHETKAIKKLYDATEGSLSIGMSATAEEGVSISVSVGLR